MVQVCNGVYNDTKSINEALRAFQVQYPQRKILNVSVNTNDPFGWTVTITFDSDM